MSELLLELFSEEIPSKMQEPAAAKLFTSILENLKMRLNGISGEYWVTPQRVGIVVQNIPTEIVALNEEIRGPKISAPEQALDGFLKKNNIEKSALFIKDDYYYAKISNSSSDLKGFLISTIEEVLNKFVWPKSMRWNDHKLSWVRPLKNILCIYSEQILPIKFGHLKANNFTFGHRFNSNKKLSISNFENYKNVLKENYVLLSTKERIESILNQAASLLGQKNLEVLKDQDLLNEIAGLVEYPVVYLAAIDPQFMSLPKEVLIITLKHHQKYLMVQNAQGSLAPYYLIVANIIANDNGQEIIKGNGKVLRARLSDAEFHYNHDLSVPLESKLPLLKSLTYHQEIGSVYQKVESNLKLALKIAENIKDINIQKLTRVLMLCKADLITNMVKEFPELQGTMGYYYTLSSEGEDIALAIKDHYKPQGPKDLLPSNIYGAIAAVAEKLDTLNQLFAINIKPTGSKDPFALRRAALGIIRICEKYSIELKYNDLEIREDVVQFINGRKANLSDQ